MKAKDKLNKFSSMTLYEVKRWTFAYGAAVVVFAIGIILAFVGGLGSSVLGRIGAGLLCLFFVLAMLDFKQAIQCYRKLKDKRDQEIRVNQVR